MPDENKEGRTVEQLQAELERERAINDDLRKFATITGEQRQEPRREEYKPWYEQLPEDHTYTEDALGLARRMDDDLRGHYTPHLRNLYETLDAQAKEIEALKQGTGATRKVAAEAQFNTALADMGREIGPEVMTKLQENEAFVKWMEEDDFTTGEKRRKLVNQALYRGDGSRGARIIRMWPEFEVFAGLKDAPPEEQAEDPDEALLRDLLDGESDPAAVQAAAERRAEAERQAAEEAARAEAEAKAKAAAEESAKDSRADLLDMEPQQGTGEEKPAEEGVAWTPARIRAFQGKIASGYFEGIPDGAAVKERLFASLRKHAGIT